MRANAEPGEQLADGHGDGVRAVREGAFHSVFDAAIRELAQSVEGQCRSGAIATEAPLVNVDQIVAEYVSLTHDDVRAAIAYAAHLAAEEDVTPLAAP